MYFFNTFVFLNFLLSSISALSVAATTTSSNDLHFQTHSMPVPTPYPHDLLRRETNPTQRTLLAAPDPTCGYFEGASDRPWGCSTGNCVFATPTPMVNNTLPKVAGSILCCDPTTGCPSSPAPTACIDNYQPGITTSITGPSNSMTLTCTTGISIFCNTLTFATPSISAFFCNYLSNTRILNATTTYTNQAPHTLTPTIPKFAVSALVTPSTSFVPQTSLSDPVSTTSGAATKGKKFDNAVIAGCVLGGVLGVILCVSAVILWRWRRRRSFEVVEINKKGRVI